MIVNNLSIILYVRYCILYTVTIYFALEMSVIVIYREGWTVSVL